MSLYVALPVHQRARDNLAAVCKTTVYGSGPGTRYSPPEDWHITLAFLGNPPEDHVNTLHGLLQCAAMDFGPIPLALVGAGQFNHAVLWAGVGGKTDRLATLAEALRLTTGADTTYPFTPHVTLGKVIHDQSGNVESARIDSLLARVTRLAEYKGPPWIADRIHLMRSYTGPRDWGVDESVASWPLEGLR